MGWIFDQQYDLWWMESRLRQLLFCMYIKENHLDHAIIIDNHKLFLLCVLNDKEFLGFFKQKPFAKVVTVLITALYSCNVNIFRVIQVALLPVREVMVHMWCMASPVLSNIRVPEETLQRFGHGWHLIETG